MRKLLLSLLLATTAATPAFSQRADREDRAESREERRAKAEARKEQADREAAHEARKEKADREAAREARETARAQRVERAPQAERNIDAKDRTITVRERQTERRAANVNERGRPTLDERRQARETLVAPRQQQRQEARQERVDSREEARRQRIDSRERYVEQAARPPRVTPPPSARPDRPAPPPPTATASSSSRAPAWHTTWRNDHRYDWRRWRDRNRWLFRLGFYFDPFGWNYRRYGIGWRLWPSYYDRHYWLNDPWMYRLPYAPWPYQWVRYYDDALLVNTMTGQVVDVMYDFFW